MACGRPAILSVNTGASDLVQPGISGEITSIRDSQAIANAVLKWAEIIMEPGYQTRPLIDPRRLSFEHFENKFVEQLRDLGFVQGKNDI